MGGAICGALLGILAGGVAGIAYGAFVGDVSRGLDGALLGGALAAVAGACYAATLAFRPERPREASAPPGEAAGQNRPAVGADAQRVRH